MMEESLQDLAMAGDFQCVADRLAKGDDPTVVLLEHAHLWRHPDRYSQKITIKRMPSASEIGQMVVPFLDIIGDPSRPDQCYAGVVYILSTGGWVLCFREYQDEQGIASLLAIAEEKHDSAHDHAVLLSRDRWMVLESIPYDVPEFASALRLLQDEYGMRSFKVLGPDISCGYTAVDLSKVF